MAKIILKKNSMNANSIIDGKFTFLDRAYPVSKVEWPPQSGIFETVIEMPDNQAGMVLVDPTSVLFEPNKLTCMVPNQGCHEFTGVQHVAIKATPKGNDYSDTKTWVKDRLLARCADLNITPVAGWKRKDFIAAIIAEERVNGGDFGSEIGDVAEDIEELEAEALAKEKAEADAKLAEAAAAAEAEAKAKLEANRAPDSEPGFAPIEG